MYVATGLGHANRFSGMDDLSHQGKVGEGLREADDFMAEALLPSSRVT
jgi:hypothetical protein